MPKSLTLVMSWKTGPGHLNFSITIIGVVEYGVESDGVAYWKVQWQHLSVFDRGFADVSIGSYGGGYLEVIRHNLSITIHVAPVPFLVFGVKTVLVMYCRRMCWNCFCRSEKYFYSVRIPDTATGFILGNLIVFHHHCYIDVHVIPEQIELSTAILRVDPRIPVTTVITQLLSRIQYCWGHSSKTPVAQISVNCNSTPETFYHQWFSSDWVYCRWVLCHRQTQAEQS